MRTTGLFSVPVSCTMDTEDLNSLCPLCKKCRCKYNHLQTTAKNSKRKQETLRCTVAATIKDSKVCRIFQPEYLRPQTVLYALVDDCTNFLERYRITKN